MDLWICESSRPFPLQGVCVCAFCLQLPPPLPFRSTWPLSSPRMRPPSPPLQEYLAPVITPHEAPSPLLQEYLAPVITPHEAPSPLLQEYLAPVITPHEAMLAFSGRSLEPGARYPLDFAEVVQVRRSGGGREGEWVEGGLRRVRGEGR